MARIKKQIERAKKVTGTESRPRLAVFKSLKHIGGQLINDEKMLTVTSVVSGKGEKNNITTAKKMGLAIAEKAKALGITKIVFDRRQFRYHGKVKAFADGARAGGLQF